MPSLTVYFDRIKNTFNCSCCITNVAAPQEPELEHEQEQEREQQVDITLKTYTRERARSSDCKHPNYYKKNKIKS
jgi:hypothetical protein